MRIEEIWFDESWFAKCIRILLLPLACIYGLGAAAYRGMYAVGLKRAQKPHAKIVCIGNLAAGGSGKTPVTISVAKVLQDLGYSVVIGCSGYGSPRSEAATLAPGGKLDSSEWGDEPAEFREMMPDLPIIVGRRRVLAAQICAEHFPESVLLMDDGFQHLPLAKDVTIVLDDPDKTPNRFAFPAGPFREVRAFTRATLFLPSTKFRLEYSGLTFSQEVTEANLLCAIGRPDLFESALLLSGIKLHEKRILPDHDSLQGEDLFRSSNRLPWIVTAKDWVKIRNRKDLDGHQIIVAKRTASIQPYEEFAKWLKMELK